MKMKWNCIHQRNAIYENGLAYARETQFMKLEWNMLEKHNDENGLEIGIREGSE